MQNYQLFCMGRERELPSGNRMQHYENDTEEGEYDHTGPAITLDRMKRRTIFVQILSLDKVS